MTESFLKGRIVLHSGDSREVIKTLPDCSVDSVVSDPPYALVSVVKRFGNAKPENENFALSKSNSGYMSRGFMGKSWDTGEVAFDPEFWREVLRVLKPGGHLVAMGGTRTFHRLACAIEDAGFEIRDMVSYLYGSGFPKSHNISRAIGICLCEAIPERDVRPLRTANVPEAIDPADECGEVLLSLVPEQGSPVAGRPQHAGDLRAEKPGMEGRGDLSEAPRELRERPLCAMPAGIDLDGSSGRLRHGASPSDGEMDRARIDADGMRSPSRPQAAKQHPSEFGIVAGQSKPQAGRAWEDCGRCGKPMVPDGLGSALKPACEPICLARKPLSEKTVAANVLRWGTGAINVDGCRVGTVDALQGSSVRNDIRGGNYASGHKPNPGDIPDYVQNGAGRWPANIIHDGSEEVVAAFPDANGSNPIDRPEGFRRFNGVDYNGGEEYRTGPHTSPGYGDSGSAARFFYTAKADSDDRLGSKHPTVKPIDLMQWLCRLVTPPGGTVLDPFSGTGTTAEAAYREGFNSVLIEREAEYQADIKRRMALILSGPGERKRESIKAKVGELPFEEGSLFA